MDANNAKNPLQQVKSTMTYLKIATFEAVTGIASRAGNQDDDGNGAGDKEKTEKELEAERAAAAKQQEWLDAIDACTSDVELSKRKKELVAACGGSDKVPPSLVAACVAKKASLAKATQ